MVDDGLETELAHAKRILHDEAVAGVESDEADPSGLAGILEREECAGGRRLVRREDAIHLIAETVEQILHRRLGGVARRPGVLIRGDELDLRIRRPDLVDEALLALLRAEYALLITQRQDFALASQQFSHLFGGKLAAVI